MSILSSLSRRGGALALASLTVALLVIAPAVGHAHVTVWPRTAAHGAYERYVVRVPNEKDVATTRVEIRFPAEVRISSFLDVAGWKLEVLTDSAGKITGAVWTGSLPPKRFVEFPFVAVNPKEGARVVWPAFQTYEGNQVVEWTGPEGSKTPASVTTLSARPTGGTPADTSARAAVASGGGSSMPLYV
ncbi:MAG: nuclear export factor, partial [Geminicoccaceae bacterium]|nr:nuclear export factor [Geminicoccaceae bacterium]